MLPRSVASLHVRCRARVGEPTLEGPARGGVRWGLHIRGSFWLAILNCEEVVDVPIFVMHALDVCCREMRAVHHSSWVLERVQLREQGSFEVNHLLEPEAPHPECGCGKVPTEKCTLKHPVLVGSVL
eukprot:728556-Rhodomonas_salina.1